jgi:hypothetical protein
VLCCPLQEPILILFLDNIKHTFSFWQDGD